MWNKKVPGGDVWVSQTGMPGWEGELFILGFTRELRIVLNEVT